MVARLRHPCLVQFIGASLEGEPENKFIMFKSSKVHTLINEHGPG